MAVPAVREKLEGVHYTPGGLAAYLARKLVSHARLPPAGPVRVLDPACGDGSLLTAIAAELGARGVRAQLTGYDIDADAVRLTASRLRGLAPFSGERRDFLDGSTDRTYDLVIANPPYVRTQHLGAKRARELGARFGLTGRVDLYQAFIAALHGALSDGGTFGLIASNRFLVTQGGRSTRALLAGRYRVDEIVDLGDTKLFGAAVLPALVFATKPAGPAPDPSGAMPIVSIYAAPADPCDFAADTVYAALDAGRDGAVRVGTATWRVRRGTLTVSSHAGTSAPWVGRGADARFMSTVDSAASGRFADLGPIKVGVKTTADRVFIRADWNGLDETVRPEPSLIRPLVSSDTAHAWTCRHSGLSILYPYDMGSPTRVPVELDDFPRARSYLELHRSALAARHYVVAAGRQWWEIWVPHRPASWRRLKVVFPDISVDGRFAIDRSGALVNGNCYWIPIPDGLEDDAYLAVAVANSSLAMRYYDARFGNRLYAGRRRFISQYVGQFPLPDPHHPAARRAVALARTLEATSDPVTIAELAREADAAVWTAFGAGPPE